MTIRPTCLNQVLSLTIDGLQHLLNYFARPFLIGDLERQLVDAFESIILLRLIIKIEQMAKGLAFESFLQRKDYAFTKFSERERPINLNMKKKGHNPSASPNWLHNWRRLNNLRAGRYIWLFDQCQRWLSIGGGILVLNATRSHLRTSAQSLCMGTKCCARRSAQLTKVTSVDETDARWRGMQLGIGRLTVHSTDDQSRTVPAHGGSNLRNGGAVSAVS
jgi:hypothetical protein